MTVSWNHSHAFAGHNTLVAEIGKLDYHERGLGEGKIYRGTLYKGLFTGTAVLESVELGIGIQYYRMDRIDRPPGLSFPVVMATAELKDYFPFFSPRFHFPLSDLAGMYLGARIGIHYVDWNFTGVYAQDPSLRFNDEEKYNSLGFDFYTGLKLGIKGFPLGAQAEVGVADLTKKIGKTTPFALYGSVGVSLTL